MTLTHFHFPGILYCPSKDLRKEPVFNENIIQAMPEENKADNIQYDHLINNIGKYLL